jgi:hypothetical protein
MRLNHVKRIVTNLEPSHTRDYCSSAAAAGNQPARYLYSEHPLGRPVDGAAYVQTMLNAIWSNPRLAATTVVFIDYDENDGFFDHLVPPAAPAGTPGESCRNISLASADSRLLQARWSPSDSVHACP